MKILAFAGSNSSTSINGELIKFTLEFFEEDSVKLIDLNDYEMPLFSVDKEKNGYPPEVEKFMKEIAECDTIICSLAEHNRAYTVAFKNIFDWCSRVDLKVFQDKPMLLMSTSPGRAGGARVMEIATKALPFFGGNIKAVFSLPSFNHTFEIGTGIIDDELRSLHLEAIEQFKNAVNDNK